MAPNKAIRPSNPYFQFFSCFSLFVLENSVFTPWSNALNAALSPYELYSVAATKNGRVILGTIADGLIALNQSNQSIDFHLTRSNGIENNTVLSLFEDAQSNVWAGLDNGIACINAASNIRPYVEQNGLLGTTYASAIFNGNLYLGTNQGLFFRPLDEKIPSNPIIIALQRRLSTKKQAQSDSYFGSDA